MKEKLFDAIEFWKDFLPDKRFSLRYKIGVIILGESFHISLVFAHINAKEILYKNELYKGFPEAQARYSNIRAKCIVRDIEDAWR